MQTKLVLAETPSMAQSIAMALDANKREERQTFGIYPYQEYKSREMQIISKTR